MVALGALALALAATACSTWNGFSHSRPEQVRSRPEVALGNSTVLLHVAKPSDDPPKVLLFHVTGDSGWYGLDPVFFDTMAEHRHAIAGVSARAVRAYLASLGGDATPTRLAAEYIRLIALARERLGLSTATPVVITGLSRGAGLAVVAATQVELSHQIAGVLIMGLTGDEDTVRPAVAPFTLLDRVDCPLVLLQSTKDRHVSAAEARRRFGPDSSNRTLVPIEASGHTFGGNREELFRQVEAALAWIAKRASADGGSSHGLTSRGGIADPVYVARVGRLLIKE
jgi:pimeloyl-ACP methyl ester carboxylesterase